MDENLNLEELAAQGIILEPAVEITPEPLKQPTPYVNVPPEQVESYRAHIVHYFDNQMNYDIMMLPKESKERLFQMLTDYADVLEKIFHPGVPILEHILGKKWAAANANPHAGINYDHDCPIIAEYEEWKQSNVQNTEEIIPES